jgi:hypothetical protein
LKKVRFGPESSTHNQPLVVGPIGLRELVRDEGSRAEAGRVFEPVVKPIARGFDGSRKASRLALGLSPGQRGKPQEEYREG